MDEGRGVRIDSLNLGWTFASSTRILSSKHLSLFVFFFDLFLLIFSAVIVFSSSATTTLVTCQQFVVFSRYFDLHVQLRESNIQVGKILLPFGYLQRY
jgi:hypothetical protein